MQKKLALTFIISAVALFALSGAILFIIFTKGDEYSKTVLSQQNYRSTTLPFKRGTIVDRNQTILAASQQMYNLILDPSVLNTGSKAAANQKVTIEALCDVFEFDRDDLEEAINKNPKSAYIRYARQLTEDKKSEFEKLTTENNNDKKAEGKITGVWFEAEYKRVYPNDTLACTVLGFSGSDSTKGNWGIEQYYNDYLVGTNGREFGYLNSEGVVDRNVRNAKDGDTIVSTIDYTVQKIVENAIADFVKKIEVDNIGVVVMDPNNGEILGMATNAVYNPNDPSDMSYSYDEDEIKAMSSQEKSDALNRMWRNFTISDSIEPGSTAKAFTEAAALEENIAQEDTTYICDGGEQIADRYIRCSHEHGQITLPEALGVSCNDAIMQMSSDMGAAVFCKYQRIFGLGRSTGIDLPGESSGILYSEDKMGPVDLATNSFGQNFTATMVQMAAASASILNGGYYYQPHIVKKILSANGEVVKDVGTTVVRKTVSESTAEVVKEGLSMVVADGTGSGAQITGYTVGGKTGTAEKYPRGNNQYVMSFLGFTPVEAPELLVYVVVDNPQKNDYTFEVSETAVPLERTIMASLLDYLHITPDASQTEESKTPETDENGETVEEETTEDASLIKPTDDDDSWEDKIPEGGFVDGDESMPEETEESAEESGESQTGEETEAATGENSKGPEGDSAEKSGE